MIFQLAACQDRSWGPRIDELAAIMGPTPRPFGEVEATAKQRFGWSRRRTRCVLAAGEDARFMWDRRTNRWRVLGPKRGTRWSDHLARWVAPGFEAHAEACTRMELNELCHAAPRLGGRLRRSESDSVDIECHVIPHRRPKPAPTRARIGNRVQPSLWEANCG